MGDLDFRPPAKTEQPQDISARVLRLARMIDRLPVDNTYIITLTKPKFKDERWVYQISESKNVRDGDL